jgi:hypothetical protein
MTTIKDSKTDIKPPPYPWTKGVTDKYRCFSVDVEVVQTNDGNVFSNHKASTDLDEQTISTFPNGGIEQIAFGLLMEAVRRETFIATLINLTKNDQFIQEYLQADKDEKMQIELSLAEKVKEILSKNIAQMSVPTAREILFMFAQNRSE